MLQQTGDCDVAEIRSRLVLSLSQSKRPRRSAFTLVELLVVIAIIGILVSLLLPAVQAAREAGRRTQCSNSQKQLALGMHNYHATHEQFPAGQWMLIDNEVMSYSGANDPWVRWSWFQAVLPYVEQQGLADIYAKHLSSARTGSYSYTNLPSKEAPVAMFMCPNDPANPKTTNGSSAGNQQGFHGNYMLLGGNSYFNDTTAAASKNLNGLFYPGSQTTIGGIRDGTSNTFFSSEIILTPDTAVGAGPEDIRGRYHNTRHAGALFSTLFGPNASEPDRHNYCMNTVASAPCTSSGTNVIVLARSYHTGGVVASMADGSVRFVSDSIDLTTYRAMGSRAGGESVNQSF